MTRGLFHLDVPFHLQEPNSCRNCCHSFYKPGDKEQRYLRCRRSEYGIQCCYERHETGSCGPAALYWEERKA